MKVVARPVAVIGGTYYSTEGASIAINGTGSSDADGTIQSYVWNFGDGSTATGASVSHTYSQDGAFAVTLTVTDNDGLTATSTSTVQIANVAPTISALPNRAILQGETYTAQGSFTDPGNDTWAATVNYGDGPTSALALSGKSFALSHRYMVGGTFTVTVEVRDDDVTSVRSVTVSVMNVAEVLKYVLDNIPDINTMENKIQSAIKQFAMGKSNLTSTISHLNSFLDELDKAVRSGAMTYGEAAPLRELIQRVVSALSGQSQAPVAAAPVPVTTAPTPVAPPTGPLTPTAGPRAPGSVPHMSAPSNQMPVPTPWKPVSNSATPSESPRVGPSSGKMSDAQAASLWRIVLGVIAAAGF